MAARNSHATNFKLGAVIIKGNKILGIGENNPYKTHPQSNTTYQYIHAELSAIINARANLTGASIYVYRAGRKDESPLISKPCSHCMELLKNAGIVKVFYSTNGGYAKFRI